MRLVDITNQFRLLLPKYTDLFSDTVEISSITASSGVATIITSGPHGFTSSDTGNSVTLSVVKTQTSITGVSKD